MSANDDLAVIFRNIAAIFEIRGENPFKAIAFSKVSRILGDLTMDLRASCEDGSLKEIEGIGDSSRKIIEEYCRTGRSTDYEELAASIPSGLLPLLAIPGLGPKTIALFWKERGVTSMESLVEAIDSGALAGLKGVGAKKIESIKQGIALRAQAAGRIGLPAAMTIGDGLLGRLRALPDVAHAELAGSLRRCRETIGDVDLLCAPRDEAAATQIAAAFVGFPEVQRILGQGITKCSVMTAGGVQVDLRMVPAENFGAALMYFTGSKDHNVKLRGRAIERGMTLNEWGLYRGSAMKSKASAKQKTAKPGEEPAGGDADALAGKEAGKPPPGKAVASRTEADVYAALDLAYIEPELRESRGEVEAAQSRTLPHLVTTADIRGDLHAHTTASDGVNTIEEMAAAAKSMGYEYLAITDHSKSQVIANGLSAQRLLAHAALIRKISAKLKGITLLAGCEVDILADGRLDFEDSVLAELDIVVASPHLALKQDEAKATDRMVRAIENPYVNVIGHPTGRLINRREGLPLNFERIFAAAAASDTALEINAGYPRLDLNDVHARGAIRAGVRLSVDTDAHSTGELSVIGLGITVARRAWATRENIINCLPYADLHALLGKKRP